MWNRLLVVAAVVVVIATIAWSTGDREEREQKKSVPMAPAGAAYIIEPDAVISEGISASENITPIVNLIKIRGYRCDSISSFRPLFTGRGFKVQCNDFGYVYEVEDRGGHVVVCYRSCS